MKTIFILFSFLFMFSGNAHAEESVSLHDMDLKNVRVKSYVGLLNTTVVLTIPRQFKKSITDQYTEEEYKKILAEFEKLKRFDIKEKDKLINKLSGGK